MEWQDEAIVLSVRPHGEGGGVVSLLSERHGRHAGYVHGAKSSRMRGTLEPGNIVQAHWRARVEDQLGNFTLELEQSHTAHLLDNRLKLLALQSAAALSDVTLPEREPHAPVYYGFRALLEAMQNEFWGAAYVYWELRLLQELGFGIDLYKCAATGATEDLVWVSPRSGRAVCREAGEPYKYRLLAIPDFLSGRGGGDDADVYKGLKLTGYFITNRAFAHTTHSLPDVRLMLEHNWEKRLTAATDTALPEPAE